MVANLGFTADCQLCSFHFCLLGKAMGGIHACMLLSICVCACMVVLFVVQFNLCGWRDVLDLGVASGVETSVLCVCLSGSLQYIVHSLVPRLTRAK